MVIISCSSKFHAFALAEQMAKNGWLNGFYTSYAYAKNTLIRRFVKRVDKEEIPVSLIHTNLPLAFPIKLFGSKAHVWNDWFDRWVASRLTANSKVFIGWSGMSLHSLRAARKAGMITVLERGSSHIVHQHNILKEEYKKFGKEFAVHPTVMKKELREYEEADYISIPSFFVRDSFIQNGVPVEKLIVNPYGVSGFFKPAASPKTGKKFTIVYLGSLSIRKGLIYLMEALNQLELPKEDYEVWFIGSMQDEIKPFFSRYQKENWKFFGQINHYDLKQYLSQADVGIQPSLEEGLSMVIPQMMACGLAVIVTRNTGGENMIKNGVNGFVVPAASPASIAEKINLLYKDREILNDMKKAAGDIIFSDFTWDDYGKRYIDHLQHILSETC